MGDSARSDARARARRRTRTRRGRGGVVSRRRLPRSYSSPRPQPAPPRFEPTRELEAALDTIIAAGADAVREAQRRLDPPEDIVLSDGSVITTDYDRLKARLAAQPSDDEPGCVYLDED